MIIECDLLDNKAFNYAENTPETSVVRAKPTVHGGFFVYPARASNSGSTAFHKRAVSYEGLIPGIYSGERPSLYFRR